MSKSAELEVMENMIAIEGVRPTRTALVFTKVDEGTLRRAGLFLQSVDACAAWWWGDFLAAYCGYEIKAEEDELREQGKTQLDEITRSERLKQYSARYAVISGKEPKTLWQYLWIARFYNSSCRQEELTWTHHVEATVGAEGDLAKAQGWLDAAVKNRWSASELRAAIRKTKRHAQGEDEGPAAQTLLPIEVVHVDRWSSAMTQQRVQEMTTEEAKALLLRLARTAEVIGWLTRRVSPELAALDANATAVA